MKNERGLVFPITVFISFFIAVIFVHSIELYKLESEFSHHAELSVEVDSLMKMAINDVKRVIAELPETTTEAEGTIMYPNGSAYYRLQRLSDDTVKVNVSCISKSNGKYEVQFTLLLPGMELLEWNEQY